MNVPNVLTILRILAVPAIVALFLIDGSTARWSALIVFALAALTDYLDGYLARAMSWQTSFGRLLDPIADKILVSATLLLLAGDGVIVGLTVIPAVLILCREFAVTGLREFMAEQGVSLRGTRLAKWKTLVQMLALGFLIVANAGPAGIPLAEIGVVGLWLAAALTLVTGFDYVVAGARQLTSGDPAPARDPHGS